MKKILLLVVGLITSQAFAQFTLSGELRPRAEYRNGYKTLTADNSEAALFVSQRTRINSQFVSENYTFFVSVQYVRVL